VRRLELTREEEEMLNGERGEAIQQAMEIIVKVGEVLKAKRLVKISHAHASGVSYGTIGEPGLHWLRSLSERGAKVSVYSTVNPIGMDLYDPRRVPVNKQFYMKQLEILKAFEEMGFDITVTCTPYYLRRPTPFERLAWGESSAVAYANSVLGAFTNREGGPVAVAAALTGRIYEASFQILENRKSNYVIRAPQPTDPAEWGALGLVVGKAIGSGVPRYLNPPLDETSVKALLAASAASGGIALSILDGITPKGTYRIGEEEKIDIEDSELNELIVEDKDVELIFHGCPHTSLEELRRLRVQIRNKVNTEVWIATSPKIYGRALQEGIVRELEEKGVKFVRGTCSVVTPIEKMGFKKVATTSAKTFFYLKRRGLDVNLIRFKDLRW